tara:strand:- start:901 stop:2550 length:1650 start_codon:yes stop_codon:yes gene_type:complete
MKSLQNFYFSILIVFTYSCQNSGGDNKPTTITEAPYLPVYSQSDKALELYRKAENNIFELEFPEANKNYLAALELDPNFAMVKRNIRETDSDLKKTYIESANKFVKSNPDLIFEPIMFKMDSIWKSNMDWGSRREQFSILMDKLIQEFPNNFEAYLISGKTNSNRWDRPKERKKKSIEYFHKAIELAPNNPKAYKELMEYKYIEQLDIIELKNSEEYYNEFDNELSAIVEKFSNSPRILSTASKLYSNAYNLKDDRRKEKSINLAKKAVEVARERKSSSLNLYYRSLAGIYSNCGLVNESEQTLNLALDNYEDDSQLINTYFDIFALDIYNGQFLEAVKSIEEFKSSIGGFGFSTEDILKCKVGFEFYNSVIYAHANQKNRTKESLRALEEASDELLTFYGFDKNDPELGKKVNRLPNDRDVFSGVLWKIGLNPGWLNFTELLLNTVIGDFETAERLQIRNKEKYGNRNNEVDAIMSLLKGDVQKSLDIFEKEGRWLAYFSFFRGQALLNAGYKDKAKIELEKALAMPALENFWNDIVIVKSRNLHSKL